MYSTKPQTNFDFTDGINERKAYVTKLDMNLQVDLRVSRANFRN